MMTFSSRLKSLHPAPRLREAENAKAHDGRLQAAHCDEARLQAEVHVAEAQHREPMMRPHTTARTVSTGPGLQHSTPAQANQVS